MPHLVQVHNRFQSRGVVFIGLTKENQASLAKVQGFLSEHGITWRNGYGATRSLARFQAQYIPAIWVVGRDGKVVWNRASRGSMEDAIEDALATEAPTRSE
ncbi:MAG: peroxiredoxin family protein [Planctomycetaceae bacterium]